MFLGFRLQSSAFTELKDKINETSMSPENQRRSLVKKNLLRHCTLPQSTNVSEILQKMRFRSLKAIALEDLSLKMHCPRLKLTQAEEVKNRNIAKAH
jgi:hypothetical protein